MRIGIDIDGVLTDIEQWQLDEGSKHFKENKIINPNGYDISEIFGISKELDADFWEATLYDYVTKEPSRKFADEVTNKLHKEGYEIYIITARIFANENNELGEKMRNIVKNWLSDYNIYYDKILFTPEDKLQTCIENSIDIMIEDSPHNINKISTKIPVICFSAGYNKECQGNNIYRAYSWYDIYKQIKDFKNK